MKFFKLSLSLFLFTSILPKLKASVIPADNSAIHFTTVYFEEDFFVGTKKYALFISQDSTFKNSLKPEFFSHIPAFWLSDLKWGGIYFWKVLSYNVKGALISSGKTHKFSIVSIVNGYYDEVKLKINANKLMKESTDLIGIDNTRSIYTRNGQPVWTIPRIPNLVDDWCQTRNLTLTKDNTLLLFANGTPLEIDFEGNVIWKGPDNFALDGEPIVFHHDLKKDTAGNYFVLGDKSVYRKLLLTLPNDVVVNEAGVLITDSAVFRKTKVGLLLKFDKKNNLLWSYDFNSYIHDEDLNYKKTMSGFPSFSSHLNAFSLNTSGSMAYVGFRDLNRIVKLDLKTKKVLATYGEKYPSGDAKFCNNLFQAQHDARITDHNTVLILNNNGSRSDGISSVIEFRDTLAAGDSSLVWKLDLNFDGLTNGKSLKGGSVEEMENKNLFVCAGDLNRIFEVTRDKKIVWDAFVFSRGKKDSLWQPFPQYRASVFKKIVHYHFLVQSPAIQKKENDFLLSFLINNTGNVADQYLIEVFDKEGQLLIKKSSKVVEKNSSVVEIMQFSSESIIKAAFMAKISSLASDFVSKTIPIN